MDNKTIKGPWEETDFRLIIGRTKIDYDWTKEETNRKKHGYSLESAVHFLEQTLLFSPSLPIATSDPIELDGEIRYQHMVMDSDGKVLFFVTTMRPEETVRLISFRRASSEEEIIYHAAVKHKHVLVPKKQKK
jgi:uncharacterized DUF497 family protein